MTSDIVNINQAVKVTEIHIFDNTEGCSIRRQKTELGHMSAP